MIWLSDRSHSAYLHLLVGVVCALWAVPSCAPTNAVLRPSEVKPALAVRPAPTKTTDEPLWRLEVPQAGTPGRFEYPVPTIARLKNGLRVYSLERKSGPVAISVVVSHGAWEESEEQSGLAALTVQLMAEATKRHNHVALSELAESLGSSLEGDAGRDYVRLSLDCLPEDLSSALSLLAEAITIPAFDPMDFERLRQKALDTLRAERQIPGRLASLIGLRALLGPDRGSPVTGCPKSVRALKRSDVQAWHSNWVTPDSTALLVVGPVSSRELEPMAERLFGRWKSIRRSSLNWPVPSPIGTRRAVHVLDQPGSVQSAIFTAQPFPKHHEPGQLARQHLDNILGGLFTSRINKNLREEHAYTYGARSSLVAARTFGLFTLSTSVATEVTVPALLEIEKELLAVRGNSPTRPISPEELVRSRADLIQSLGAHLENSHLLLRDLEHIFVYDKPARYYADYPAQVAQVTEAAVATEAQRLAPLAPVVVIVGDERAIRLPLEAAGFSVLAAPTSCIDE